MRNRRTVVLVVILLGLAGLATAVPSRQANTPVVPAAPAPSASPAPVESAEADAAPTERSFPEEDPRPGPGTVVTGELTTAGAERRGRLDARQGDIVRLTVRGEALDSVAIEALDELEVVDPESPARFEFIAERPGTFPITLVEASRPIGRLVVRPR